MNKYKNQIIIAIIWAIIYVVGLSTIYTIDQYHYQQYAIIAADQVNDNTTSYYALHSYESVKAFLTIINIFFMTSMISWLFIIIKKIRKIAAESKLTN